MSKPTPMLRQYLEIKKQYPGTLLFFRLGDFYEMFNEDAVVGSKALEITLTARQKHTKNPVPMCGVPHHAASNYIAKLIRQGFRVAICEQTEEASAGKKLVKREVVRVITPGTAIDEQLLEKKDSVYLASVCGSGEYFGISYLDLSTGQFFASEIKGRDAWQKTVADIKSNDARELLYPQSLSTLIKTSFSTMENPSKEPLLNANDENDSKLSLPTNALADSDFELKDAERILKKQFGVRELTAFGLEGHNLAISAAGACLAYAHETQRNSAKHISEIEYLDTSDSMILDAITLRNLDVFQSSGMDHSAKRSLIGVIDQTVTGMGARMLRTWLLRPSMRRSEIETRTRAITELNDSFVRDSIKVLLREIVDIERLVGRLNLGTATARDLVSLSNSLSKLPDINAILQDSNSILLQVLAENTFELPELKRLIDNAIDEEPPVNIADGGTIKKGFNSELDELREISKNAKQTIVSFEDKQREITGIANLRIKFNNVFGYFIEVSKANTSKVPENFERRQTLANAERYTTPELKNWESKVLGAEERIGKMEIALFKQIRSDVSKETRKLQSTARALATLDALASLSEVAMARNYVAPILTDGDKVEIKAGRHPIVEAFSSERFVPNNLLMNNSTDRLLIITGANMGGKSTILRQVALIQILAQIGSYVPADAAELAIVDRIWTRVGASDDLASGRSTFMVEMTETATILNNATPRSLILLDEIGRGTSTFDGLAIAWAVAEYLHNSSKHAAKTLFATHYHELTELAEKLPGAKNYQITAVEKEGNIVFLHKLEPGKASKSYGIAVAKLAGLPSQTVERAKAVLNKLEEYELVVFGSSEVEGKGLEMAATTAANSKLASQVSLFALSNEDVINELRNLDVEGISPEESQKVLLKLKNDVV